MCQTPFFLRHLCMCRVHQFRPANLVSLFPIFMCLPPYPKGQRLAWTAPLTLREIRSHQASGPLTDSLNFWFHQVKSLSQILFHLNPVIHVFVCLWISLLIFQIRFLSHHKRKEKERSTFFGGNCMLLIWHEPVNYSPHQPLDFYWLPLRAWNVPVLAPPPAKPPPPLKHACRML